MEFLRSLLGLERKERALEQAGAPVLTLHIGLPKTASTFLQRSVFSSAPGLTYVRKYKELPLPVAIEKMQRVHPRRVSDFVDSIGEELPEGNVLVSNENVSMHVKEPWADKGPTPTRFCERVVALEPLVGTLRVILGIRRQDQWLASRYAESAKLHETFSQEDFDRRAEALCDSEVKGSLIWLDFDKAVERLVACLGRENVLLLPMEKIASDPEGVIAELQDFLSVKGWLEDYRAKKDQLERRNVLSVGDDSWQLKGHDALLTLGPELKQRILERYRAGNREVSERMGLDLDRFGYF